MPGAGSAIDYNTLSFTLLSFLFKSVSVIGCPINLKVGMPVFPVGSPPISRPPKLGAQRDCLWVGGIIRTAVRISPVWVREFTNSRSRKGLSLRRQAATSAAVRFFPA